MPPAPPRLRILSGESALTEAAMCEPIPRCIQYIGRPRGFIPSTFLWRCCFVAMFRLSFLSQFRMTDLLTSCCSGRQCRVCLPIMETLCDQRVRRDSCLEVWLRVGRAIRHIIQVRPLPHDPSPRIANPDNLLRRSSNKTLGQERFKPRQGS